MDPVSVAMMLAVLLIGAGVGFLGGLLGKGGSAVATPLLVAIGLPPIVAVAAPLPATIPGALVAASRYRRLGLIAGDVMTWSLIVGIPATIVGALATRWIDGSHLVVATEVVIVAIGVRMLMGSATVEVERSPEAQRTRTIAVALVTGLAAGLLANSGGFLLAPLFVAVLGMTIKPALGTSLAVASALAVPGTVVHFLLGHLDLQVVAIFAVGSVPLSSLGARVALRTDGAKLERLYGGALVVLGIVFLAREYL